MSEASTLLKVATAVREALLQSTIGEVVINPAPVAETTRDVCPRCKYINAHGRCRYEDCPMLTSPPPREVQQTTDLVKFIRNVMAEGGAAPREAVDKLCAEVTSLQQRLEVSEAAHQAIIDGKAHAGWKGNEPAYLMKLYRVDEVEGLRQQVGELEAALDHADARILELVAEVGTRQQRMGELLANYSPEQYVKKYEELVQALTEISKGGGGWTLWQIAARALSNSAGKEGAK
jgi:hypothetical protein